jgi:CO/xanthine dehydrogenase Mo-binding subunit
VLGAAVDGGVAITPDVVTAQIEGATGKRLRSLPFDLKMLG